MTILTQPPLTFNGPPSAWTVPTTRLTELRTLTSIAGLRWAVFYISAGPAAGLRRRPRSSWQPASGRKAQAKRRTNHDP